MVDTWLTLASKVLTALYEVYTFGKIDLNATIAYGRAKKC